MKIYMVRHAKSIYVNGQEKSRPLSQEGLTDAKALVNTFKDIDVSAVYASDYLRAEQTVEPIAKCLNLQVISKTALRERKLKPESCQLPYENFIDVVEQSFLDLSLSYKGCESIIDAQNRVMPVIKNLIERHKSETIVIGSHGNIMTAIFNYYDKSYGFDFWQSTSMPDIYVMTFEEEKFVDIKRIK